MVSVRNTANLFLPIVFCLLFVSGHVMADQIVIGRIIEVNTQGNVVIEMPDGPVPVIGDTVTIQESAFGGIAAYYLGEWIVTGVENKQVQAEVKKLAGKDLPKVGGNAHVYIADPPKDMGQNKPQGKEQVQDKGEDPDGFEEL